MYNGETKPILDQKPEYFDEMVAWNSRHYLAIFYGVYVDYLPYLSLGRYQIRFGQFDGVDDRDETVTINWPDGTSTKIDMVSVGVTLNKPYPAVRVKVRIDNGEWLNTDTIFIEK